MSASMSKGLILEAVGAGYRTKGETRVVVRDVSAVVAPGELVCLLGVNGAGKSTLLRTVIGDQQPLSGHITLGDRELCSLSARERARRLAVLLTDRVDVPLMKTQEIVALGRSPHQGWFGHLNAEDKAVVEQAMERTGAIGFADRFLGELSDGERQRVMLARAMAQEPELLVLDEPLAFLDLVRRVELMDLLRELADDGLAVLLSIHDVELALRSADALWIIDEGRFEHGAPEDLAAAGKVGDTFGSHRVRFDHTSGTFVGAAPRPVGTARVEGEGVATLWARRALQRARYAVVDTSDTDLVITSIEGRWQVSRGDQQAQCATLREVVHWLKANPLSDRSS